VPLFATVGFHQPPLRPIAVRDVVEILCASLLHGRLTNQTVAVTGPEELTMRQVVERVARVLNRRVWVVSVPVVFHHMLARVAEAAMDVPLVARAQVRMLAEGLVEPAEAPDPLPDDLRPRTRFTDAEIRRGLPPPGPFTRADLSLHCARESS
jgi:NADH dehydrogenase